MVKVSIIITVLNEENTISDLIYSLKNQTLLPFEVVIVDGGSTDKTWEKLQKISKLWSVVKTYQRPGNRSTGRNFGVTQSKGQIIAFTDAGCLPHDNWLQELTKPFNNISTQVVSGYYEGTPKNIFEKCLIPYVLVMPDRITSDFLPSTRSMAIRKKYFINNGAFNENCDPSEDFEFATRLRKRGTQFVFEPKAIVSWEPRKTLKDSFSMFFRFAAGDIIAGIIRPKVKLMFIRYFIYIYLMFLANEISFLWPIVLLIGLIYLLWSIKKNYRYVNHPLSFFWLPVLQITSDIAVLIGSFTGFLVKPYSNKPGLK